MATGLRACLLVSAAAGLTACASSSPAPIDYRMPAASTRVVHLPGPSPTPAAKILPAAPPVQSAATPPPRVVDMGSPTLISSIDEAKSLDPESGGRPGGRMVQAKDNPSARAVSVTRQDTLYDISRRYNVNMRALIETNHLEPPYSLDPGRVIYLPPPNVHVVERGETLYSVSRRYNVDTRSLALLNSMSRPWSVWPGDELLLPPLAREQSREAPKPVQAQPVAVKADPPPVVAALPLPVVKTPDVKAPVTKPAAKPAPPPADVKPAATKTVPTLKPESKPAPSPPPPPAVVKVAEPVAGSHEFIWPVSGLVLKAFGSGADGTRNDGVNISAADGADVRAAAGGEVVYAGSELAGFGNLILIRHPGGWVTAYAHSEAMLVKEGDLVKQGQVIAKAGATGNAASTQVHFELRKGKEPVDPAAHLPPLQG